jgi:site-specific DNA-methyltransferase (adenine-specific)
VKDNHSAGDLTGNFGYQYEMLLFITKGRHRIRGKRYSNVWQFSRVPSKKLLHPAEKPVGLVRRAIEASSDEGQLVIDPFCGSGTTGVAAVMEGRRFLGIELDAEGEGHADVARERIRSAFLVGPRSTKRSFVRDSQAQARIESGAKYEQKAFKF